MTGKEGLIRPYSSLLIQLNRLTDAGWIVIGLAVAVYLAGAWSPDKGWLVIIAIISFALCAELHRLYRPWRIAPLHEELSIVWRCWITSGLVVVFFVHMFPEVFSITNNIILIWLGLSAFLISASRFATRLALRITRSAGRNFRVATIIGANDSGQRMAHRLLSNRWMGIRLLGYFDDRSSSDEERPLVSGPVPVQGNVDELLKLAESSEIDIVYIALPMRAEFRIKELIERLSNTTVSVYYVADISVFDVLHAQWEALSGVPVLRLVDSPIYGFNSVVKRLQDICFASILIIVLALPMMIIALAIKLTSPGPFIYRQIRHGLDGKEFTIWKFRTMTAVESDSQYQQARRDDRRVTPVGGFLRRTSLDELPQLFNVIQGRMSLVGPRPHPLKLNEEHRRVIRRFVQRHKVRPGITGWAQINGYRGETDTRDKMLRRLELDLDYINNWSFWLDLRILLLTTIRVWQGDKAY